MTEGLATLVENFTEVEKGFLSSKVDSEAIQNDKMEGELALRQKFENSSREFESKSDAFRNIKAMAGKEMAIDDKSLIINALNVINPDSTVMEGNAILIKNGSNVPNSLKNMVELINSHSKLTEAQRAEVFGAVEGAFQGTLKDHNVRIIKFRELAKQRGLNPDSVIEPIEDELKDTNLSTERLGALSGALANRLFGD